MGHAERLNQSERERFAALSAEPRCEMTGTPVPSPWLEEQMRQFGGSLIQASNELAAILNPPRVVGPDGRGAASQVDFPRTVLINQMLMLRALSAMNDCLLTMTCGKGVLVPLKPPES